MGRGGFEHNSHHILYTRHIVTTSSTEQYSFMIILRTVFKKESIGKVTQGVKKRELSFLYATHRHDLFYITVKYHDYIPNGFQVAERT